MHLLRVVDRPDVHVDPAPVSELDEPASDDRDGSEDGRHLQDVNVAERTYPGKTDDGLDRRAGGAPVHRSLPTRRFTRSVRRRENDVTHTGPAHRSEG